MTRTRRSRSPPATAANLWPATRRRPPRPHRTRCSRLCRCHIHRRAPGRERRSSVLPPTTTKWPRVSRALHPTLRRVGTTSHAPGDSPTPAFVEDLRVLPLLDLDALHPLCGALAKVQANAEDLEI